MAKITTLITTWELNQQLNEVNYWISFAKMGKEVLIKRKAQILAELNSRGEL